MTHLPTPPPPAPQSPKRNTTLDRTNSAAQHSDCNNSDAATNSADAAHAANATQNSTNVTQNPARPATHVTSATAATVPAHWVGADAQTAASSATQATVPVHNSNAANDALTVATELHAAATRITTPKDESAKGEHDGEMWGDFILGKMLGRGGMGAVYAGRQVSLDRPVAIKLLSEHLTHSDDFKKRFLLEARAAARINSPYVVQVYFAGSHTTPQREHIHFFAMEYVEGTDLARKLKNGWRPTPPEALALVIQAAKSLVALGDHAIVHRDIKPANFMFTMRGDLKLMDFGLVKFASEAHGLTQTGTVMGTVNYFSPEQGRGENCDHRTDIYALGVMFYELLTGKLPFAGGDATSVIYQHIHAEPKPPREINPDVSLPYQAVVLKCLEKKAEDRYASATALLSDLQAIERGLPPLAIEHRSKKIIANNADKPSGQKAPLFIAAAVILAAVVISLAILLKPAPVVATATTTNSPAPAASAMPVASVITAPPIIQPTGSRNDGGNEGGNEGGKDGNKIHSPTTPSNTSAQPEIVPSTATPTPAVTITTIPTAPSPPNSAQETTLPPVVVASASVIIPAKIPAPEIGKAIEPVIEKPIEPVIEKPSVSVPPVAPTVINPPAAPQAPIITPPLAEAQKPPLVITTTINSTIRVSIPSSDPLAQEKAWLWWLSGKNAAPGRLQAKNTLLPQNTWTAPALPGEYTLHIAAMGNPRVLTMLLRVSDAPLSTHKTLAPFGHAFFSDERYVRDLQRDNDGSWWGVDINSAAIVHFDVSWFRSERVNFQKKPSRPQALALLPQHIVVLDDDERTLMIYNRDGTVHRTVTGLQRPTDVIVGPQQLLYVADMKAGGILVYNTDGVRVHTLSRTSAPSFYHLTRLATNGTFVFALDSSEKTISVFNGKELLTTWPLEKSTAPIGLAHHANALYVLLRDGAIRMLDAKGQLIGVIPAAQNKLPLEELETAGGIAIDVTGEIYVTYPEHEAIVRYSSDTSSSRGSSGTVALRHARTWTWRDYSADQYNNIYALDRDRCQIVVLEADGWRTKTIGAPVGKGGTLDSPILLGVAPNGTAAIVFDEETYQLTRYNLTDNTHIVFGEKGSKNGQFDSPVALAMDDSGRSFVLDTALHRVIVFDKDGKFMFNVGRYERGDAPDMLRVPRQFCVNPDGTQVFIYDEASQLIKQFFIDYDTQIVRHMRHVGGPGTGAGQFTRVTGMGCDRNGRLYVLDYKRGDLQVFNSASDNPQLLTTLLGKNHAIRKMLYLALNPEGLPFIIGGDQITGLHWQP
jgi:serine/threonine protein kinase